MLRKIMILISITLCTPAMAQLSPPAPAAVSADCLIRINTAPNSWFIEGYDPFANGVPEGTFSATFVNDGNSECRFTPVFQLRQPPFGLSQNNGQPIQYVIVNMTNTRDATPRSGRSQRLSTSSQMVLQPRQSTSILYKLVADKKGIKGAGNFSQEITLEAQDSNFRALGGTPILIGINVLPSARIGLAGAYTVNDGQAIVNLGQLKTGIAPLPLQLRVSSTSRYNISITSANSGKLRQGASQWSVPYSMIVNGTSINLSGAATVSGPPRKGARSDSLPIQFVIGDISNQRAGNYSDTISISVTAR